ncbi:hypothetical protein [Proteiniclasticum sp. QWL-01]|uniref:hypothetical protein n=1 Tax=Proteiniclasticum sp. QWL-01 TaxID=3036945 RepID=UPI00240F157A|nr:hypothetical protein [Proteiniclasticum sp. QWL-01]WFF72665.1 hypothetical protein P6M73_15555 [Proteiniclasticum sp. QWL-01]
MRHYVAFLELDGVRTRVEFKTDIRPVEYLWQRYGMSTFIESVETTPDEDQTGVT